MGSVFFEHLADFEKENPANEKYLNLLDI